jgi:glutamine amidotransferase
VCRLFGLNAGTNRVHVRYWLAQAPDSVQEQSRRNPDGTGVGWFDATGVAQLRREPRPAAQSRAFGAQARQIHTNTIVTHIRAATTGVDSEVNCHPFLMAGRLMAHNGGFGQLDRVVAQLGDYNDLVVGQTDSEHYAALIAQQADLAGGDVGVGIAHAAQWLAANVAMYSLNTIVISNGQMWALRYPDSRALHIARRVLQPATGAPYLGSSLTAHHECTAADDPVPVVIVASERIDDSPDWRMLAPGELIEVASDLSYTSRMVLDGPPANYMAPAERDPNIDTF